ncbi:DUF2470 domain-containing protein [Streptomyces sp. LP05-1]|uniref:DUF2470 domain-containing protein n=1 Tax=Streptomyces pyxinae TaxID=2970734 RepID=A0ABT2CJM9_9ACTN|nr:DUF2470 domain-containing protein [Streptomyces sp. LP05-1]MCS0637500.1 DUF2470 domain-containing protein [Streptomyces sp. LP05-1]
MSAVPAAPAEPTTAEQIRSVLARAVSLSLVSDGHRFDLAGQHTVDARGQVRLHLPADSALPALTACAPRGSLAVLLEFTDIAPVALRDRVRARVTLSGWLARSRAIGRPGLPRSAAAVLRLDMARATLETATEITAAGLDELVLAEVDPLAVEEAALLTHLAGSHRDVVTELTRLVDPRVTEDATRTMPVALDRYGLTLRYEYQRGHVDARLVFPKPLREAAHVGNGVQQLLAAARGCRHLHRSSPRP